MVISSMTCFVVVYALTAVTSMYLAFTSKKQVLKGLLTGDQKQIFPNIFDLKAQA